MMLLSNSKLLNVGVKLLSLVLVAKVIALVLWWYLPSEGVDLKLQNSYRTKYQRVDFSHMLASIKQQFHKTKKKRVVNALSINSMVLSGLYGNKHNGFAIVAKKSSPKKTKIVAIGESFEGYTLKDILSDGVVFSRASKEYILKLKSVKTKPMNRYIQKVKPKESANSEYDVSKKDIDYYSSHPSQIWKDIAISEIRKHGKITGFRVNRIRKNSKMAMIGLQVGDVIIRANNVDLKSYRDALNLYNDIDKIDTIDLIVLRNNQEKEIIYEIR